MYYCTTIICHDVLMIFINLNDIAVLSKKVADYHCIVNDLAKSDTLNLRQNAKLTKDRKAL